MILSKVSSCVCLVPLPCGQHCVTGTFKHVQPILINVRVCGVIEVAIVHFNAALQVERSRRISRRLPSVVLTSSVWAVKRHRLDRRYATGCKLHAVEAGSC